MEYAITTKDLRRFWTKVKIKKNGCWQWLGNLTTDKGPSYRCPQFWLNRTKVLARRVSFVIHFGENPDYHLKMSCKNQRCINPFHIKKHLKSWPENLKTHIQFNTKTKGRSVSTLDIEVVNQIITLRKLRRTWAYICKKTGVSSSTLITVCKMARYCKDDKLKER